MAGTKGDRAGKKDKTGLKSFKDIEPTSLVDKVSAIRGMLKEKSDGLIQSIEQIFAKPLAKFRSRNTPAAAYYDYAQDAIKKLDSLFAQEQDRIKKWHNASAFYFLTGSQKSRESILKEYEKKVKVGLEGLERLLDKLHAPLSPLEEEYTKLRTALETRMQNFEALHHFLKNAQKEGAPLQLTDPSLFAVSCKDYHSIAEMRVEVQSLVAPKPNDIRTATGVASEKPSMSPRPGAGGEKDSSYRIYTVTAGDAPEASEAMKASFLEVKGKGDDAAKQPSYKMQFAKDLPSHSDANRQSLRIATAMAMAANMLARLDQKPSKDKPLYLFGKNQEDMVLLHTCLEYTMKQIGLSPKQCIKGDIEFKKMQEKRDAFFSNDIKTLYQSYQKMVQEDYGYGGKKAPEAYAAAKATDMMEGTKALGKYLKAGEEDMKKKLAKLKESTASDASELLAREGEEPEIRSGTGFSPTGSSSSS